MPWRARVARYFFSASAMARSMSGVSRLSSMASRTTSRADSFAIRSSVTVCTRSKPTSHETSVHSATATSTLGTSGATRFNTIMMLKAPTAMMKVGQ